DLGASVSGLQWTVDAYTLVLAGFLVLGGSAADRFGRKRVFQCGLAVFGVGSLLCSLAPGIGWLIAARAVQAVGGTMLNPIVMALFALCGFGAFLFVTTQYLQDVRGMTALSAGLCLVPVGVLVLALSPRTGRLVGTRGPRLPLVVAGVALAAGGAASAGLGP